MAAHPRTCTCAECGAPSALLDFGYQLPDDIWDQPVSERSSRNTTDLAELGERRFVRGLLPVKLVGGEEFRYGVWLEVTPTAFDEVCSCGTDKGRYARLQFVAKIANAAPPWRAELVGIEVDVQVRDPDARPFVVAAREAWLQQIIERGWTTAEYDAAIATLR